METFKKSVTESVVVVLLFLFVLFIHLQKLSKLPPLNVVLLYFFAFATLNYGFKATYPKLSDILLTSTLFYIGAILHKTLVHECSEKHHRAED